MIDHMAVMRRQIEEMQEKAMEGRSIAEAMLADVVASVVEESEGGEVFTSSNSGFGAASPDYEPPGSPEYIPPQNDMETEVAETSQEFKCRICGFISEGVIFQLYEHLEEKHGMEGAEEAELEKCCVKVGAEEEEDSAVSKKSEEGLEPRSESCIETENKEVAGGAKMANKEKVDLKEQVFDQKEKVADLSEEKIDLEEQEVDLNEQALDHEEKGDGLDETKEVEGVIAKDEGDHTINQEEAEDNKEGDPASSPSSVVSGESPP